MKTAINFKNVTHIRLLPGGVSRFDGVTEQWFKTKPEIRVYERDYVYASKKYETIEEAEKDFARISANMGLKVI